MVFHTALRALELELEPVNMAGFVMNQPMFGGKRRTRSEIKFATDQLVPLPALDLTWELALPVGADRDHVYCNPVVDGPHRRKVPLLGRFLVIGFEGDPMFDRQQEFVKMLVLCGVRVMAKLDEIGFHGIDLVDPRRARIIMSLIKDFVRR
ncbi:hypothetical protein L1049_018802 [Liquidambar formosana]|uniref:Alpha/beta hydrolase fold-3 domain-containing protein n=1 Tax=Liquidambar formosana TaxID=63359 RepID=A0AAP0RBZ9_LIQFO